jgi:hypothetical protein
MQTWKVIKWRSLPANTSVVPNRPLTVEWRACRVFWSVWPIGSTRPPDSDPPLLSFYNLGMASDTRDQRVRCELDAIDMNAWYWIQRVRVSYCSRCAFVTRGNSWRTFVKDYMDACYVHHGVLISWSAFYECFVLIRLSESTVGWRFAW